MDITNPNASKISDMEIVSCSRKALRGSLEGVGGDKRRRERKVTWCEDRKRPAGIAGSSPWRTRRQGAGGPVHGRGRGPAPYISQRRASDRASVGVRTEWFEFLKNRLRLGRRRIRHGNSRIERHVGAGPSPRPPTLTRRTTTLAWMMYTAATESLRNVRANNSV